MTQIPPLPLEFDPSAEQWVGRTFAWLESKPESEESISGGRSVLRLQAPQGLDWPWLLNERLIEWLRNTPHKLNDSATDSEIADRLLLRERLHLLLQNLAIWHMQHLQDAAIEEDPSVDLITAELVGRLYQSIYMWNLAAIEGPLLQCLSWNRRRDALRLLVELIVQLPPHDWSATALAISPLMRSQDWPLDTLFPRILDAMVHPTTVASVLDLANFVVRKKIVNEHPALDRQDRLASLLSGVVGRLGQLEDDPTRFGETVVEIQHILSESVALTVSLCDALGWIGNQDHVGKLNQALGLAHRRVRTEAAAALARLGHEEGKNSLIELARDPFTRLRVLAYADELGLSEKVDEQYTTALSRAEAELALWLSQPQHLGLPPSSMELVDERVQFWPSFHEPQDCFLFRFQYDFPGGELSNIGIAGPMVHAFAADLADLPIDDIYAAFAGWIAEHEDIYEVDFQHMNSAQRVESNRLFKHLQDEEHNAIEPLFLGFMLGERSLVAKTRLRETQGLAVTDGLETVWFPTAGRHRPLGPLEVYCIYKGRKILRTFNP